METIERRRCTATSKETGQRCARTPIIGGSVCFMHGGSAPAAQAAAKLRLIAMVERVLGVFEDIVTTWRADRCPTCGLPTGDPTPVIRVGQLVLDRAGFGPKATMEVIPTPPSAIVDLSDDEMVSHLERLLDMARAVRDRRPYVREHYIDGTLLDSTTSDAPVAAIEPPHGATLNAEGSSPLAGERSPHGEQPLPDARAGFAPVPAGLNPDGRATVADEATRVLAELDHARRELADAERELARVRKEERS